MKKLGKKINTSQESVEAYFTNCDGVCRCACGGSCTDSYSGMTSFNNSSSGGTYSHP